MTTVRTYFNHMDAGLAKSLLESHGIPVYLHGENAFSVEPVPAFGLRLQVPDERANEARRILGSSEENVPLTDDFVPPPSDDDETEHPKD